jgi:hypothetical protein
MLEMKFLTPDGDPMIGIQKDVEEFDRTLKLQMDTLAVETALKMKDIITENKLRPQAGDATLLENAVLVPDYFEGGWGVGDIAVLDNQAPYWRAVNFGSSHMVGKRVPEGKFFPKNEAPDPGSFRQDRWKRGPFGYSFIVKNPIPAMNFVEKTAFWLSKRFDELLRG